jgi:hypothetical protein
MQWLFIVGAIAGYQGNVVVPVDSQSGLSCPKIARAVGRLPQFSEAKMFCVAFDPASNVAVPIEIMK